MATPRKEISFKEMSLKLLIDKNSNKVVLAEAGKDFVDFLFGLLEVPLGTIMRVLCRCDMARSSFGRVYESVENLESNHFQTNKESHLRPEIASSSNTSTHPSKEEGYVKGIVTYTVMDNLTVKPLSNISSCNLLKALHVKDVDSLEEKTVEIDLMKGLDLMMASFESFTVLTDVFIGKKIAQLESNVTLFLKRMECQLMSIFIESYALRLFALFIFFFFDGMLCFLNEGFSAMYVSRIQILSAVLDTT